MGEVEDFYARGLESDRLSSGAGALEFARTSMLLERVLPGAPATIADIGGGPGRYATWLAGRGYRVHLVDPVPLHTDQARAAASEAGVALASTRVGDARALDFAAGSFDAVLLLGPLYHLPDRSDRSRALSEARRICRPGGVLVAAAISRFASTLDGLRAGYLTDPAFATLAASDVHDGRHVNPTGDPAYFTTAYFHRPDELRAECEEAGFIHERTVAVEGPAWLLPDLEAWLADPARRRTLLSALTRLEAEPSLLGASAHLLVIAIRP
jgi:SAM-dependent methyltransferase